MPTACSAVLWLDPEAETIFSGNPQLKAYSEVHLLKELPVIRKLTSFAISDDNSAASYAEPDRVEPTSHQFLHLSLASE